MLHANFGLSNCNFHRISFMVVRIYVEYLTTIKRCRYNTYLATVVAFNTLPFKLVFGSYLLGVHETVQTNFLLPSVSIVITKTL